ncbi:uncharacterized CDP-alcohol phosphatidyltransferase class-I family protein 3-like [Hylaeus volcanicus]|uniref:uncharacterized CDP-alcohol phosphatidyltransferase class-I family protein 3-like n=1 Tax=Hylaeus volcanicus TaxID=313075 RepID=UPI0023B79177|nr:uncharacterized CDP-alcohol phosphatidyltransferase class-I family protein 3-like [Hylaeus volcanicus]XP_053993587.1 uncharacterized CDP-alcohol phosphatidyltransferase class-I family protein 3-like [Hylaeus volcanicus]XP_053993588.1 uncharacterized CDP-alcohol phosphatidyltransferase class-I family protein 3-like [Hylaeus volcanicus]
MYIKLPWHYLSEHDLKKIKFYKFKAGQTTTLDSLMNHFWTRLVLYLPMTLSPNLITMLGFLASTSAFISMMYATQDLVTAAPQISCLVMALGVFLHQTLDALDGKQARRTNTSSPLGALFDHGCDIVTLTFFSISSVALLRLGLSFHSIIAIAISGHLSQFLYLWWEYHFDIFYSNPGFGAGVTEAQCSLIILALITSYLGADIWLVNCLELLPSFVLKLSIFDYIPTYIPLNQVICSATLFSNLLAYFRLLYIANKTLKQQKKCIAFLQLLNFFTFTLFEIMFFYCVTKRLGTFPLPGFFLTIFVYGILAVRLLLSATSKKSYSLIQTPSLPFVILTLLLICDYYYETWFSLVLPIQIFLRKHLYVILWIHAAAYIAYFIMFSFVVIHQIKTYLSIDCFSIKRSNKLKHVELKNHD